MEGSLFSLLPPVQLSFWAANEEPFFPQPIERAHYLHFGCKSRDLAGDSECRKH